MTRDLSAGEVVLPRLLERYAEQRGHLPSVSFEDGTAWSGRDLLAEATAAAAHLHQLGVRPGDRVLIMASNGPGWLRAWWGATLLGCVIVPVNVSLKGQVLRDVCEQSEARCIVLGPDFHERLDGISSALPRVDVASLEAAREPGSEFQPPVLEAWDVHSIMWTSGTTGPSKGSLTAYRHLYMVSDFLRAEGGLGPDDTMLVDLPLFHVVAQSVTVAALSIGAAIAIRPLPAMSRYWAVAKETGATVACMVSTMAGFLMAQPPSESERDHSLRYIFAAPLPADADAFVARFGLSGLMTGYGSTEVGTVTVTGPGDGIRPGSTGKARPGVELRIVDEHDVSVPLGEVGELVVRTENPWELSMGYLGRPDATAAAWRNGWFHTGDVFRADADGYFYFHDRLKDAIRRRGENISTFEVEREVLAHPEVAEAACVGVPSDHTDDEIKVYVVPKSGSDLDLPEVVAFLAERLPHFMVPRYFEVTESLPRTETMRVRKHLLRSAGHSASTWDRESVGLIVTRAGLQRTYEQGDR